MNWKRGLIRLWLLASLLITISIAWGDAELIEYECFGYYARTYDCIDRSISVAVPSIAACVALLIVGVMGVWVVRGFRQEAQA